MAAFTTILYIYEVPRMIMLVSYAMGTVPFVHSAVVPMDHDPDLNLGFFSRLEEFEYSREISALLFFLRLMKYFYRAPKTAQQ